MIVWLASFPRSGNTFLRIAMHRLYGVRSSVAYDMDGVAERLGRELVGFEERPADYDAMRRSGVVHFVKTHRQCDERIQGVDRAICLVRDGRDALVSWARLLSENMPDMFEMQLREMMEHQDSRGTGSWGANVLSWLQPPLRQRIVVKFEELVAAPARVVAKAVEELAPELRPVEGAAIPSFAELAGKDGGFFRNGVRGDWRNEMPSGLHDFFWSRPENRTAMKLLGYD